MDIPVYLVAGFLDAGKTNFINGILEDGFAREDKTLLLCCEEGEEEYEKKALDNVTVVTVDDEDELTADFCRELEKKYRPKQVLIEYNGMWRMEKLYRDVLPANWVLYQIMTFVQAPTFELFVKNMGQLMMEKITNADMLVFNRCTPELKEALRARNLRMVNRRADIYLEDNDGNSEDYLTGNECPFDMTPDLIDIPDDDYGVWYVDVMDHLDRWDGKRVHMKLLMCHSKKFPGIHCPGRFVMTCCENDIQFVGVVAKGKDLKAYKNRDWVEVTATVRKEYIEAREKGSHAGHGFLGKRKAPAFCKAGAFPVLFFLRKGNNEPAARAAAVCLRPFPPRQSRVPRQPDRADLFHALAREPRRELCAVRQKILAPSAVKRPLFQRAAAVWTVHLFSSFLFISLFRSLPAIFSSRIPHRIQNSSEIRASPPPRRSA